MRQLAEGLGGYEGPTLPPSLREQGGSLEVSLQGWLGPGQVESCPLVTHITEEGPLPGVGPRDSGPQKQLVMSPTEPLAPEDPGGSGWPAQNKCSIHWVPAPTRRGHHHLLPTATMFLRRPRYCPSKLRTQPVLAPGSEWR